MLAQNQVNQFNQSMANSTAQNNAAMAQANAYDPFASGGGFGKQTADYAALGAAYGRQVAPSSPEAVAAANAGYNYIDAGGGDWSQFDAQKYLTQNPDVYQAGGDSYDFALQHAQKYGVPENRPGIDYLQSGGYFSAYPSGQTNVPQPSMGYPAPSPDAGGWSQFDAQKYLTANPDVYAAGGDSYDFALDHAKKYGVPEGRPGIDSTSFTDRWGSTPYSPELPSYITNGTSQPTPSPQLPTYNTPSMPDAPWSQFDAQKYLTANPDVYAAGGDSYAFALDHAKKYGLQEGRPGIDYTGSNPYGNSGGLTGQPYGPGYFDSTFGEANTAGEGRSATVPGQPYGPGYFDNTFGSANDMQMSRDNIAKAWMNQQMANGDSRYTQGGNIYGFGAPGSGTVGGAADTFTGWDYQNGTPGGFDQRYYAPPAPMSYDQGVDELARLYNEVLGPKAGTWKSSGTLNPADIMIPAHQYDPGG
jgi:hypothetical protein